MREATCHIRTRHVLSQRSSMIFGHFIEHFHRQIYGGLYDPGSVFADEDGLRKDVLAAMSRIRVPIIRWPGGCFVSAYHWMDGVGPSRQPSFDKAWRVEEPNAFGTDEYVRFCRKIGCEPYICTNAGTGSAEEMSNWLEYCNLRSEGRYARMRINNGFSEPHGVRYWSIGNENYGTWEIGAKSAEEWSRLVLEAAKMLKRVDPTIEVSAAALPDIDWNVRLLERCGKYLDWISIHKYWDSLAESNDFADYMQTMAYTADLSTDLDKVRGLLTAFGLDKRIKIAYDEWNLRGWHHPNVLGDRQGRTAEEYILPRDLNDRNQDYTMADAVFTACFLNELHRHSNIVGMANFSPILNTRGCIYTHSDGIVLRSTYHVFDLYVNYLGEEVLDGWLENMPAITAIGKDGRIVQVDGLDMVCTRRASDGKLAVAIVNKHPDMAWRVELKLEDCPRNQRWRQITVNGDSTESYNDVGMDGVCLREGEWKPTVDGKLNAELDPHSVNVIQID